MAHHCDLSLALARSVITRNPQNIRLTNVALYETDAIDESSGSIGCRTGAGKSNPGIAKNRPNCILCNTSHPDPHPKSPVSGGNGLASVNTAVYNHFGSVAMECQRHFVHISEDMHWFILP